MQLPSAIGILFLACYTTATKTSTNEVKTNIESLAGIQETPSQAVALSSEPSSKQLGSVAGALTHLLNRGASEANNSAVVTAILELVNVTMKGKILLAHEKSTQKLLAAEQQFDDCLKKYKAADKVRFPPTSLLQGDGSSTPWYEEYFESYLWCKNYEANLSAQVNQCDYYCLQETQTVDTLCVALNEECNQIECAPVPRENYRAYLERMVGLLEGYEKDLEKNENFTFNASHKCTDIKGEVETCYRKCDNITTVVKPQTETVIASCCAPRATAESGKCNELKSRREAWLEYDSCYDSAISNWETVKADQEAQGISRMGQMRSILRIVCIIESFGPDQKKLLPECMEKSYKEDPQVLAMKIVGGEPESKLEPFACNKSEVPGSPEFDSLHYSHLPDGISACPALACEDACGLSSSSKDYTEVEVCVGLGEWQSTAINSAEGWSKMGAAYRVGTDVECTSSNFFNAGSGACSYAACPEGAKRNTEDAASTSANPTKGPGDCPCNMTMQRKTTTPLPEMTTVAAKCVKQHASGKAVYWDLKSEQSLGAVTATLKPGVGKVEVYLTNSGPEKEPTSRERCGTITSGADCSARAGRFLALKGISAGNCVMGTCEIEWCQLKVDNVEFNQEPIRNTGESYNGEVVVKE